MSIYRIVGTLAVLAALLLLAWGCTGSDEGTANLTGDPPAVEAAPPSVPGAEAIAPVAEAAEEATEAAEAIVEEEEAAAEAPEQ